jgi:hypothetical protein
MINKTILFIDPAAILSMKISFQSFRVSNTGEYAISFYVLDKDIDAPEGLFILHLPVQVIGPGVI